MVDNNNNNNIVTPRPDPTKLTTEQLNREIGVIRELIVQSLNEQQKIFSARLEALIDNIAMLRTYVDRHTDIAVVNINNNLGTKIADLDRFMIQKIDGHIKNLETRLDGSDVALTAALQSADKAAEKQSDNFTNILNEMKSSVAKQLEAMNSKIDDLKERISESGGRSAGAAQASTSQVVTETLRLQGINTQHGGNQNMIASAAIVLSLVGLLSAFGGWLYTATRPSPVVYTTPTPPPPLSSHPQYYVAPTTRLQS